MRIQLKNLTGIASLKAGHFDLHEDFGVACLVETGERVTLCLNQVTCRSWLKQEYPHIEKIKERCAKMSNFLQTRRKQGASGTRRSAGTKREHVQSPQMPK
ncbi:MAG: hypothetical protein DLM68_07965 [Hyphomicrobiales bacterium]|nr:MAG: hypothetical protein DLM68_07965 [Hyphomicrobiales bacterium]